SHGPIIYHVFTYSQPFRSAFLEIRLPGKACAFTISGSSFGPEYGAIGVWGPSSLLNPMAIPPSPSPLPPGCPLLAPPGLLFIDRPPANSPSKRDLANPAWRDA